MPSSTANPPDSEKPTVPPLEGTTRLVTLESGLRMHVRLWGPADGPLIVLLHGFPETGECWQKLAPSLASEGWQVVAPDQRGYGRSAKPEGVASYELSVLADDVLHLAKALGQMRFGVVGHDWGGIVAWHLAAREPQRLDAVCILNAPHPASMAGYALTHPTQVLRSAYVGAFQLPLLPECILAFNDHALLIRALTGSSRPHSFEPSLLDSYRASWRVPGTLHAMLNWYRALPRSQPIKRQIDVPVCILWGDQDLALEPGLAIAGEHYCRSSEIVRFPHATHWLHHEEPTAVAQAVGDFLKKTRAELKR